MKKFTHTFFVCMVSITCIGFTQKALAQEPANHVFHVITWYSVEGMDSVARAERNAMLKEYFTKVTMKNEFVIHQWNMSHYFSEDSRELIMITEYASWADIEKAFDRNDQLEIQAWPNEAKRREFNKKMMGYFTHHKDAVYHDLGSMTK